VVARRNESRVVATELEGKKPLGKSRRRWEYNTEIYLTAIGWGGGVD
jgi:hypothetical protein